MRSNKKPWSGITTGGKGLASSPKIDATHCIEIPTSLTVEELAELLGISPIEVIKQLMRNNIMANVNQVIAYDAAAAVAAAFGYKKIHNVPIPMPTATKGVGEHQLFQEQNLQPRPPIITVMGHIDHGKTSLLDVIRQANVIATEAGSITQHIGAYQVETDGRKITFLDTPGHEAFTAMRARGVQVTDIAVLVVAADDGVMPQTIEAISHARAAGVPIIVTINKIDKPDANVERVKKQLGEQGLLIEEWGGDIICVPTSVKRKQGISELLENILIMAEILELKANPQGPATGAVIEAGLDRTKGPIATVLVQNGTLGVGDNAVVGDTWGKVKAMFSDTGKRVGSAVPATPVKILGLNSAPQAGDTLTVVASEREAKTLAQKRQEKKQQESVKLNRAISLDSLSTQIQEGRVKELNIVLKTDVQGSIEPIKNSLEQLETDRVKVKIIHSGSGNITEGDVLLALASKGIIAGFNTCPDPGAKQLADLEGVDIRYYEVIYELINDMEKALKGMLEPIYVDVIEGHAEVRAVFSSSKRGKVVGVYVQNGKVSRSALCRILRHEQIVYKSSLSSLRRFKDDVKQVEAGFECGVGIEGFDQFEVGDIIELYRKEKKY
jgi:translation initiation factor IF-2